MPLSCAVVRKDIAVDFLGCDAMFCLGSMLFVPKDDPKLLKSPIIIILNHNIYLRVLYALQLDDEILLLAQKDEMGRALIPEA